jgi:hypothetical protein
MTIRIGHVLIGLTIGLASAAPSRGQDSTAAAPTSQPVQRGEFHITFTERHPLGDLGVQFDRLRMQRRADAEYKIADESFEAYVPNDYDPSQKYGLLVWTNAGSSGSVDKDYIPVLDKTHLIWIGANNADNDRNANVRVGLALDAAFNMSRLYNIDDSRIYVIGLSGGARLACILGVAYADVFDGTIANVGASYFRDIPIPNEAPKLWPMTFFPPGARILDRAKKHCRYVFITGSNDFNHDMVLNISQRGFVADKFLHTQLYDINGMGHEMASAENFEKAVNYLDTEQVDEMNSTKWIAPKEVANSKPTGPSNETLDQQDEKAMGLYSLAMGYERNGLTDKAREKLQAILSDYPKTQAAKMARKELDKLNSQ